MPLMGGALFVEVTMENIQTSGLLLALRLNEVNRNEALEEHRDYIAAYSLEVTGSFHFGQGHCGVKP